MDPLLVEYGGERGVQNVDSAQWSDAAAIGQLRQDIRMAFQVQWVPADEVLSP